jgi:N-acetylmuramoyl-L-alanine amidase
MVVLWRDLSRILVCAAMLATVCASPACARRRVIRRPGPVTHHPLRVTHSRHAATRSTLPGATQMAARSHTARRNTPGAEEPHAVAVAHPLIVIDPGHGGRDSGAVGSGGTLEKTVTLATALELKHALETTGRYRVAMTRTSDVFVPLASRVAFARSHHAALFIAIHANASPDRRAHGASVYVRSGIREDGDKAPQVVANPQSPGEIVDALAGPKPQPRPGSAWLQYTMIDNLDDDIHMVSEPAREAHFYVLGTAGTPSVLLEMGFLSNAHDEAALNKPKYREVIARAIRDAIGDYFDQMAHPDAART